MSDGGKGEAAERWTDLVEAWRRGPRPPAGEQWNRFLALQGELPPGSGPLPAWRPGEAEQRGSNLAWLAAQAGVASYGELHRWSSANRAAFWEVTLRRLGTVFAQPPERILDLVDGVEMARWLPGARLNATESCFQAPPEQVAVLSGDEGSTKIRTTTYGELRALAERVAAGLRARGLAPGERLALYMPMTLECVAAYLGIIRAGSAVISVADSFSPAELARRLEIAGGTTVITVASYERGGRRIDLLGKVREAAVPQAIVIPPADGPTPDLRGGEVDWRDLLAEGSPGDPTAAGPEEVTNILFSSGTTGDPKAIPWTHLTPLKCAMDAHFHHDVHPSDVVAWPTNIGWMMGPWLIYAALMNRAALALYEGAPTGRPFLDFVRRAGVTVLGLVPSLVRAWRAGEAAGWGDLAGVRLFSSTGEASTAEEYLWLMSLAEYRAPVIEYLGGTEIGGGHITGSVLQPASPATFTTPALGLDFRILDEEGGPVTEGQAGELFLVPPSLGLSQTLLNRDHHEVYYEGCPSGPDGEVLRRHGDQIARLPGGWFRAGGRMDDTMNLGGIKVSSVELERAAGEHPGVRECAAVAVKAGGEGVDLLVLFVVPEPGGDAATMRGEVQRLIGKRLNPLFRVHDLTLVESLPRTASNKIMRRELRARYEARP